MSYIVPRDIPRTCGECPCSIYSEKHQSLICMLDENILCVKYDEHYAYCQLTEIPPHGRLIDADQLNIYDISPVDGFCVMGVTEEDIGLADTVIEAEGEVME